MAGFLEFAKHEVGLTDQTHVLRVFEMFCNQVGPIPVAIAARASLLTLTMGEKLLRLHMGEDIRKARTIAETLSKSFFHHGYPLSRREAKDEIKLPIEEPNDAIEDLMWKIWLDIEIEMKARQEFNPLTEILSDINQGPKLLRMVYQPISPLNIQPQLVQNLQLPLVPVGQQAMMSVPVQGGNTQRAGGSGGTQQQQVPVAPQDTGELLRGLRRAASIEIDPIDFGVQTGLIESTRRASHEWTRGKILACRLPDLNFQANAVATSTGWSTVPLPLAPVQPPNTQG